MQKAEKQNDKIDNWNPKCKTQNGKKIDNWNPKSKKQKSRMVKKN